MGLKSVFNTLKKEGYIMKDLDQYLLSLNDKDNDRAINVNAPSSAGGCLRSAYYSRTGIERDTNSIDPRTRRIFDNGTGVHERLQAYLAEQGMLAMDEVPLRNDEYNIQGHTDGLVNVSTNELAILEIKSINTNGYMQLKDAKEEHKNQAMIYLYCAEERRKELQKLYPIESDFTKSLPKRKKYYTSLYQHIKGGRKHTRDEKITKKVNEHVRTDNLLYHTLVPINKVIFLYEDKNDQNIKEFCVKRDNAMLEELLAGYKYLNECVAKKKVPERGGTAKSSPPCRFCNYKLECYN